VIVRGISERRGPATEAATLYEETEESRAARDRLAAQRRAEATMYDAGRPSKQERRQYDEWRRRNS
jgi:ribosome-associated heat shock protein Hsp15